MKETKWVAGRAVAATLAAVVVMLTAGASLADTASGAGNFSGWRGGIGIAFGQAGRRIPDVSELGYEISWGEESSLCARTMDIAVFRYYDSVVGGIYLKDRNGRYDFSQMEDKEAAARMAFDKWAELRLGAKGLSKYANIQYSQDRGYGEVTGTLDLSSENPLVVATIDTYLKWFDTQKIKHGGIALDNATKVPEAFLQALDRRFHEKGLGIAANGCPPQLVRYIDFFGNEGFPYTPAIARDYRANGFTGILGEFTMHHLSPAELESYLKSKLFNGIVFFGYTGADSVARLAQYSVYGKRPDVYDHHRWVLRKYIPLSRAVVSAGRQSEPHAWMKGAGQERGAATAAPATSAKADDLGRVDEEAAAATKNVPGAPSTAASITRYGTDISKGIYLYVESSAPAEVVCDARALGIGKEALVFDEFANETVESRWSPDMLEFKVLEGPRLIQLAGKETLARNGVARITGILEQQMVQRKMDRAMEADNSFRPLRQWAPFVDGYTTDKDVSRSGKNSLKTVGGIWTGTGKVQYYNRRGAAQLVNLDGRQPGQVVLSAYSRADNVPRSELEAITNRLEHFRSREAYSYCMHLYLDYQDGQWPEAHTARFSPGSHDWEKQTITVELKKPAKTALVVLEFHQPEGAAWFDDISLTQGAGAQENLLACSGFENDDLNSIQADYDRKAQSLLDALNRVSNEARDMKKELLAIRKEIESVEEWIAQKGIKPLLGREVRDLADARQRIDFCAQMLGRESAPPAK